MIIVILWNTIVLALLLVLAWVFRPQAEQNPYLFVGEDEAQNVHLETGMNVRFDTALACTAHGHSTCLYTSLS